MSGLHATLDLPSNADVYNAALEGVVRANQVIIRERKRSGRPLPSLRSAGAKWKREKGEIWQLIDKVIADGYGDCEDLAAGWAAELRESGIDRNARAVVRKVAPGQWHAEVERSNGLHEDPSRILGAIGEERVMGENIGMDYIGADPVDTAEVTWEVHRIADGWRGVVRVPLSKGVAAFVHSKATATQPTAINEALKAASGLLKNPAVSSLIPGPAKFALQLAGSDTAKKIAKGILGGIGSIF